MHSGAAALTENAADVIQRVATGETTAHGTVEVDVHGTVEQCTGKSQSCSTYAHNLNKHYKDGGQPSAETLRFGFTYGVPSEWNRCLMSS